MMATRQPLPIGLRPAAPDGERGSQSILFAAPHRLPFLAGISMLLLVSLWWAVLLAAPYAGITVATATSPMLIHGFAFAAAFMPMFMAGFMTTAGPRWLDVVGPRASTLRWPVAMHVTGVVLLMAGAQAGARWMAFGALLLAMAWTFVGVLFAGLVRSSRARDKLHAKWVMAFWVVGIASAVLFAAGLGIHHHGMVAAAVWLMILGFAAPIYATVAHRLLPFFTSNAMTGVLPWRPNWVLAVLLASVLAFGVLQLAARLDLLTVELSAWLTVAMVGPGTVILGWVAVRWGLLQSLRGPSLRLLAMLHLGFVWLVLCLGLAVVEAVSIIAGAPLALGLAPLHALTIGFLGGMLFAMASRVVCGHGGLPLTVDAPLWALFWLLQAAALLRLASPMIERGALLTLAAASIWLLVWFGWGIRFVPVLCAPRRDGRPG